MPRVKATQNATEVTASDSKSNKGAYRKLHPDHIRQPFIFDDGQDSYEYACSRAIALILDPLEIRSRNELETFMDAVWTRYESLHAARLKAKIDSLAADMHLSPAKTADLHRLFGVSNELESIAAPRLIA